MTNNPEELFQAGLALVHKRESNGAIHFLRRAVQACPDEVLYRSYLGLCLARVDRRSEEALQLCREAVEQEFFRAELFCNLGRVYLLRSEKGRAFKAFCRGLSVEKRNAEIIAELKKMGIRKAAVFPFLKRSHVINRMSGRVLASIGLR